MADVTNADRAEWANTALSAFVNEVGENDDHTDLKDLLCNLMHWADRQEVDFEAALEGARFHYRAEIEEAAQVPEPEPTT